MELSFAVESGQAEMGASTDLGKFRDVNALLKAYSSLQAEFTRRSQRLKELENRMDNLNTAQGEMHGLEVEKLRESAKQRRLNGKAFDEFVYDLEKNAIISAESILACGDCKYVLLIFSDESNDFTRFAAAKGGMKLLEPMRIFLLTADEADGFLPCDIEKMLESL